jgi:circadian clock protein KaiB
MTFVGSAKTDPREHGLCDRPAPTMIYVLKLFVTGKTPRAEVAINNIRRICEQDLRGQYQLEIIDVLEQPELAETEKILATPTLIKQMPPPMRRVIGDLSDKEQVLFGLELTPEIPIDSKTTEHE